jgi:hypothetical protein
MNRLLLTAMTASGWAAAGALIVGYVRERKTRTVLRESNDRARDLLAVGPVLQLELTRGMRDLAIGAYFAAKSDTDITDDLRALAIDLDKQIAQMEEHIV